MALHTHQLPRGKRRGDFQEPADNGAALGLGYDIGSCTTSGKDTPIIITEAKRRCFEPTPFAEWSSIPDNIPNGFHHHPLPQGRIGLSETHMDLASSEQSHAAIALNGHTNGFQHNQQDGNFHHQDRGQHIDINGGGDPAAPVMCNGYYGYIANYKHENGDVEEDSMDTGLTMQAEFAINGPSSCMDNKERRVCLRCEAGEPGHITHIMQLQV
nr:uncharacterized protein LOC129273549 isoform X1 [Lytechinus pictus]